MEVRVFRARGRMRVVPEVGRWEGLAKGGKEINLTKGGALPRKLPRRYYRYALLDSLDAPFATFRYYCRSLRQLDAIGVKDLLIECSPPTSTGSYDSGSEEGQEQPEDQDHPRDGYSPKLSTNTGSSSESSGASSGEELLTRFASSGLESTTDVTKADGTVTDPPSTPSKGKSKETTRSTDTSPSPIRIPRSLAPVPKPSVSSFTSLEALPKDSPVLSHHSLTSPTLPAKTSAPSSAILPPPRSALFSPKPQHDPMKSPTAPAKKSYLPSPSSTLPQRSTIFSPKPQGSPLGPRPRSPHRTPKPRSSREHFATMIREGFPSPESARWKLDEERYGGPRNSNSNDDVPEPGGEDRGVVRDSVETERRKGQDKGSAEGKALKQGTLRKGMLKRVVESAVGSRKGKGE